MKKLLCICLIVTVVLGLSVMASAVSDAKVVVQTAGDVIPGSTILVSVTVRNGGQVIGCQVEPVFDSTVFQLMSPSWSIEPDVQSEDPASGAPVAEWDLPTTLDGELFTFTLKVKADAAVGRQTVIGCRVSATDESESPVEYGDVTEATVTVGCQHDFIKKEDPAFLETAGNCKTPAKYYVSCAVCGQKGTEIFSGRLTGGHDYSAQVEEPAYLAQAGDCKTGASYYYSCTGCGEKGTEVFTSAAPAGHKFEAKVEQEQYLSDPGDCQTLRTYFFSCTGCGEKGELTFASEKKFGVHQYRNDCDTDCDVCGRYREAKHQPSEEWYSDGTGHWYLCLQCREKVDPQPHVPGPEATAEEHQVCTVCQYVLAVSDEHRCEFSPDWSYDEKSHWHECSCGLKSDLTVHSWSVVDSDRTDVVTARCDVCGATQEEPVASLPGEDTQPTQPSVTQPTQPEEPSGDDGGVNVAAIVLGILLALSLAGNGVLGYLLYMAKPTRKRNGEV